jgi:hypothetical protein
LSAGLCRASGGRQQPEVKTQPAVSRITLFAPQTGHFIKTGSGQTLT